MKLKMVLFKATNHPRSKAISANNGTVVEKAKLTIHKMPNIAAEVDSITKIT